MHNSDAVRRLKSVSQFDVRPEPSGDGWFRVVSNSLSNRQLFGMLEAAWPAFVGSEPQKYALIHCLQGLHAGVWLHLLPDSGFEPGCHEISTF
jgi:hypothetical protein